MFYNHSKDVTPSAADVDITDAVTGYLIGTSGTLKVQFSKDAALDPRTITVTAGQIYPIRVKKIFKIGTTATGIIALW